MDTETAFLRAIREDPDNDGLRLIFADWLEERGDPLSDFIRGQCALARMAIEDSRRSTCLENAHHLLTKHGKNWAIRFGKSLRKRRKWQHFLRRVTVPLKTFLEYKCFLWFMASKAPYVLADLTGVTICQSVIEMIPESVARASLVLPLEQIGETLVLAMNHPGEAELVAKLQFILNKNIELVWAERQQIINAIERHYPNTETESVDAIFQEFVG
jgi:uncharacterized protein (TIGR02996 family)